MRCVTLTAVFCACCLPSAMAQAGARWLILSSSTQSVGSGLESTAASLRAELLALGVQVWALDAAARRFEEGGSARAVRVTEDEIQAWVAQSSAAVEELVQGAPSSALDRLNEAQQFSRRAVEALNRDPKHAQRLLDTCLYAVRALLDMNAPKRAEAQARECRQLAPIGEPSTRLHPPPVLKVLDDADAARAEQTGALIVTSEPSGCTARINGLPMGETPVEVHHLFPGQYRVQVECEPDRDARAHATEVDGEPTAVFVDVRFDGIVQTHPMLGLRYASVSDEEQFRDGDAAQIAKTVPGDRIVLMSMTETGALQLDLLTGTPLRRSALARIPAGPVGPTRGDIAAAARTLVDGQCMDLATVPPTSLACEDGTALVEGTSKTARPAARRPRGQLISGLTLVGAGSASLLTGYVLLGPRARVSEDWVDSLDAGGQGSASAQQKWFNMGTGILATSASGAAALVAAMPLALPNRAKTPWWGWFSGGLGVGFAAFSIAYGVTTGPAPEPSCSSLVVDASDARTCVKHAERVSLSVLTGVTAAPLLTIPLVYLLRRSKAKMEPSVELSRAGGYLSVGGRF
ncbi:MAG: PEGA domain-containing protein [Polyangiales bacterium]